MADGGGDVRRRHVPAEFVSLESEDEVPVNEREYDRRRLARLRDPRGAERRSQSVAFHLCFGLMAFFVWGMALFLGSMYIIGDLPAPVNATNKFNAQRALADLHQLEGFGPKVTGSFENEVVTVEFLLRTLNEIKKKADPHHNISIDLQSVNGSFQLPKPMSESIVYYFVQNIVVKLSSIGNSRNSSSLLVNCHFDSVPTSPGASDDGANCAIMLETLRVLSQGPELLHDVIFLFNGAEENPLMASHGFIMKHPLAKNVKAFINLESCGAGGKEILFQSGPQNRWLLDKYSEVPYPSALVVAEEIFQVGLIPSDTDFRIFRDYGQIPGLDFAHCLNGFVYHTKNDRIDSIVNVLGVLQHTGENLISLVRNIVNSVDFDTTPQFTDAYPIYFDIFGKLFIVYDSNASIIHWLCFVFSLVTIFCTQSPIVVLRRVFVFGIMFGSTIALNLVTAAYIDGLQNSLSWYSHLVMIILYYLLPPFILTSLIMVYMEKNCLTREALLYICPKRYYSLHVNLLSAQLFWTLMLGFTTLCAVRSSYLFIFLILPNSLVLAMLYLLKIGPGRIWTVCYLLSTVASSLFFFHLGTLVFYVFVPIAGRSGGTKNPELLIGLLSAFVFLFVSSYVIPLMFLVKGNKRYLWTFGVFTFVAAVLCSDTPLAFPFSELKPQRIVAKHVNREFIYLNETTAVDSIIWVQSLDRRGLSLYSNHSTELKKGKPTHNFCELDPHCGVPWVGARSYKRNMAGLSFYTPPHSMLNEFTVNYTIESIKPGLRRYNFDVAGQPDHMIFFITIRPQNSLAAWSFTSGIHKPEVQPNTYVVRYVHGHQTPDFDFWIDIEHDEQRDDPVMDIAVIAEKTHEVQFSHFFGIFLSKMPFYAHVTPVVSVYKSYAL